MSLRIERFNLRASDTHQAEPTTIGLNIQEFSGVPHVNIFALAENKGAPITELLHSAASIITARLLKGKPINEVTWTLAAGYDSTDIRFTLVAGEPYKLDASHQHVFGQDRPERQGLFSIERYERLYTAEPAAMLGGEMEDGGYIRGRAPLTVFASPCGHAAATDGVFYCRPAYFDSEQRNGYEFILANTQKLTQQLRWDNPDLLEHARHKFKGSTAADWLTQTHINSPRETGAWSYVPDGKRHSLQFDSGEAAVVHLVQEIGIPYFPIAVRKDEGGAQSLEALRERIGYGNNSHGRIFRPSMERVFAPG